FGFTPDEVAKIRADYKTGELYSAVVSACENGNEKAKQVVDKLVKYRRLSVTVPLSELIIKLLYETLYIKSVLAMENGTKRRNNLLLLPKYAQEFSSMSGSGIDRFIEYIKKQSDKGLKSACANMGENAVKLMSIHGSKGLQFPVCIIADTAAAFNESDTKDYFVYNTENGLGVKYFDNTLKEKVTTLLRQMQSEVISKKSLSEELRLLYVAMTRAEERLVFIASPKKLQDNVSKAKASLISENYGMDFGFKKAKSYFDWLVLAAMLHPDCHSLRGNASKIIPLKTDSKLQLYEGQYIEGTQVAGAEDNNTCLPNSLLAEKISENINYEYPYDKYREIQTKASVSAIANKAEAEHFAFSARPDFMCGGVTATGIGTAMHKVMQFFDFSKAKDIDREIDRLCEWQFITEQEAQCVNKKALKAFFESKLFDRIKNSDMVKREMRFLTEMPASLLNNEFDSEENIIVQGAVDLCFEENGEIVVLDFKTDRVSSLDDLKTAYSEQLEIYSIACEKIFSKPVKQRILYSFNLGKEIVF
ncbi:MAG: PD-(D/E)XK nuclease family protein, partial [Clostridia bacterium]|nr:PD-(D/E)XK nuclease family protein [Clostridia bacterium]